MDGHFGNSIEDSRSFVSDLDRAIPRGCNINPDGHHPAYLESLVGHLADLEERLCSGQVHYVVFAHGADSHEDDDLEGQCTTAEWLDASDLVYGMLQAVELRLGHPVPVTLALFGSYRRDDYEAVLRLHTADLIRCLKIVCGNAAPDLDAAFEMARVISRHTT